MLHNTGPYGPNETPVNMGAPLNISQLSSPMNMVQNLNNLSKIPPQPPPTGSEHFNIPNYPSYANPAVNVSPQMHSYQNYHSLGFQPSYMPQTSTVMQNSSWQNAMLPMSLNMHGDHTQNMLNYPHLDKRMAQAPSSHSEQGTILKKPLNIPQVPSKLYLKPPEPVSISQNPVCDDYKPYSVQKEDRNVNLTLKSPEILLSDNTRRRNLENTVRLIENILINTTKNREMQQNDQSHNENAKSIRHENTETDLSEGDYKSKESPAIDDVQYETDSEHDDQDEFLEDSDDNNDVDDLVDNSNGNNEKSKNEESDDANKVNHPNKEVTIVGDPIRMEIDEEMEPEKETEDSEEIDIKPVIKQEPVEVERQISVKIEPLHSWTDTDCMTPFHRDMNGVMREDVDGHIVDSDTSVVDALAAIKNGQKSESYYECPNCCLLFQHPKRFLIHAKWHSFGLINDRRFEVAREKEEKKEAQRLERLEGRPANKLWPCKHCDKVYHAKGSLDSHRQRYHSNRSRECKICNKPVPGGWTAWKTHQSTHNSDSGFQCSDCPKRFKYAHSLAKHKDTHLEKTHSCPECPKKFGSPALLKVHMKSHERARQGASFHCTFCGKAFYDKFNLQIHERTHTNERPFVCEICNATFGCNSNLSRHLKVSHSKSKPHVCTTCNRSFATSLIRDRHEMRVHGDPADFKYTCKLCPSRYFKQVDLRKHTYKMHPKPKSEKAAK